MSTRGLADIGKPSPLYPGVTLLTTEWIPSCFDDSRQPEGILLGLPLSVIDLPLSAVVDTLCLPSDLYGHSQNNEEVIEQDGASDADKPPN